MNVASRRPIVRRGRRVARFVLRGGAARLRAGANGAATTLGKLLASASTRLLLWPQRNERVDVPAPLAVKDLRLDVFDDLVAYTGLSRETTRRLLERRLDSFRAEWHRLGQRLRVDDWYYLSSSMYLFGNAIHFASPAAVDPLLAVAPASSRILDFGGGTGNLALALAAWGHQVDYVERSALQRDFVSFRLRRYALEDRVRVIPTWETLPTSEYDVVFALDVLEHVVDLRAMLECSVLPAVAPSGRLVERSPFSPDLENPMHHQDLDGLDTILVENGLRLVEEREGSIRVWLRSDST